ncbi:xanthine dehydrogenase family protein molybdopterin-binding subunit [Fulvivirga lutimaris]|uniref:xanthine dehydrogenase family protein molybdopterin-binding subunit n=1 Tax=Fulvivirga lutimaris TaxID=1819566 RepID=UPI001C888B08|nr:molybdopterin cofactor-binding domain-containing protein [Fulvivirga lutimaris]
MMKNKQRGMSRRQFLATTGGATFFIGGYCLLPGCTTDSGAEAKEVLKKEVNVWVKLASDNQVIIYTPAAEMGQGSMTSVPLILAEEMDADWSKVKILSSPVEAETYGVGWYPGGNKNMTTAGSRTIRSYYQLMRETGAQIRASLLQNAAEKWQVSVEELTTKPGFVIHEASDSSMSFGEIAEFGNFESLPDMAGVKLKDPKDFKLVGKVLPRYDIPSKTNGSATYGMDVHLPGMLYGFISRSPVHGAKPELTNEEEIKNMDGVVSIVTLDHGVGVVCQSVEAGLKAKRQMKINWGESLMQSHNSEEDMNAYTTDGASETKHEGDVAGALKNVAKVHEAIFTNKYVYHAQMEPLNAVVSVAADKQSAEVWIGSQAPDGAKSAVAQTLGIDENKITVNQLFLGGGFGRRTLPGYAAECAALAKSVDKPVKLIWKREDDVSYGAFRPQVKHFFKAGLDKDGKIISWDHTAVGPGGGLSNGGASVAHYDIPNVRFMRKDVDHGIRTKHWRAVGHGPHKYAVETFIDQLARANNKDPYLYRLEMMQSNERVRKVLERAAEMSNWDPTPKDGRAMGIAFADRDSFSCGVAEISLNRDTGVIRVHKYWCAVDAGVIVQPDNAVAQVEGAVNMGISSTLKEQIDVKDGKVVQSNFHDYPILRMSEAPESIEVALIDSDESPEGIGEAGLPAVGGAIASAFAALTGKHLYDMPFTPDKVLAVLNS